MKPFKKTTFDNGLRVITIPQSSSQSVTVMVVVEAGSKYETREISGLSHFLEHMCFKGTKNRPKQFDLVSELEGLGAESNAGTSHEHTAYYIKAHRGKLDKILDIAADIYMNSVFEPAEIDKERGVIIEEINMYEDTPTRKVHDLFMELLYGDQPVGWSIAGRKEVIRFLKREDFLKYHHDHYLADSTIVVVAGGLGDGASDRAAEYFAGIPKGEKRGKVKTEESQNKPEQLVRFKESDQTHFVLGVRAFDAFDERRFALSVLAHILGGGFSSRLFQKIREEIGAAYQIWTYENLFSDHGYLAAYGGTDHKKIDEVVGAAVGEFGKIRDEKIGEAELRRAKDHLLGGLTLNLETSDALAGFYGGQEVATREILSLEEVIAKIQAVGADDIRAVAGDIFKNEKLNLAVLGPFKDKDFGGMLRLD